MFEFFLKGGPLMWPIFLCSLISFTIILERLYHFRRARINVGNLTAQVKELLLEGKLEEAERLCKNSPGPIAKDIREHKKIGHIKGPPFKINSNINSSFFKEFQKLKLLYNGVDYIYLSIHQQVVI